MKAWFGRWRSIGLLDAINWTLHCDIICSFMAYRREETNLMRIFMMQSPTRKRSNRETKSPKKNRNQKSQDQVFSYENHP
jgi:hypothetical protein